jgi:hypothetical protein
MRTQNLVGHAVLDFLRPPPFDMVDRVLHWAMSGIDTKRTQEGERKGVSTGDGSGERGSG